MDVQYCAECNFYEKQSVFTLNPIVLEIDKFD